MSCMIFLIIVIVPLPLQFASFKKHKSQTIEMNILQCDDMQIVVINHTVTGAKSIKNGRI